ncbi:MAG TPA: zinc ribbon domain-containing protein [Ktedonobacteraceae bacterium]|nr:zinc ribbon domain-containing protein [Ktedonobacteraceae bacterium]
MLCPNCNANNSADDQFCHECGTELTRPSTSLVTTRSNLPAILSNPQLPRVAAGVGAVAFGFGLELVRRSLLARMTRGSRKATKLLPALTPANLREILTQQDNRPVKLPRGYEIHETVVYMSRVIRRED